MPLRRPRSSYARSSKHTFHAFDPQGVDRKALEAIGVLCGEQPTTGRIVLSLYDWARARANGVRVPDIPVANRENQLENPLASLENV